jgi:hypothetical protein
MFKSFTVIDKFGTKFIFKKYSQKDPTNKFEEDRVKQHTPDIELYGLRALNRQIMTIRKMRNPSI